MTMGTGKWKYGNENDNGSIAMATWQWENGNDTIAICFNHHVANAMLPLSWEIWQ